MVGGNSISLEAAAQYGVEDYSEEFAKESEQSPAGPFSNIINQDRAVKRFAESLSLRTRAILNLGAPGVGKSTATNDLVATLRALDRGESINGQYADEVREFHRRLQANRHGDIIGLWNPKDYNAPIVVRTKPRSKDTKSVIESINEQTEAYLDSLLKDAGTIIKTFLTREYAITELHNELLEFGKTHPKMPIEDLEWKVNLTTNKEGDARGVKLTVTQPRQKISKDANSMIGGIIQDALRRCAGTFTRDDAVTAFKYILDHGPQYILERTENVNALKKEIERDLQQAIEQKNGMLRAYATQWEQSEPTIAAWFNQVADYLGRDDKKQQLLKAFLIREETIRYEMRSKKKEDRTYGSMREISIDPDNIQIEVFGKFYTLDNLLDAGALYTQDAAEGTVIREVSPLVPMELFTNDEGFSSASYDARSNEPIHQQIELGPFAYADLVVMDDGIGDTLLDPDFRMTLLTFLQEGEVRVFKDKVQINTKSDCVLIANETENPFMREKYKNAPPEADEGMRRRFTVIEWPKWLEADGAARRGFPHILKHASKHAAKEWLDSGAKQMEFTPQATNLIYQHLLAMNEPHTIFPMNIGEKHDQLFIPLMQRVRRRGKSVVDADDVIDFVWDRRDHALERLIISQNLMNSLHSGEDDRFGKRVGQCYGLAIVNMDKYAQYGSTGRINAIVERRIGRIGSADVKAEMTDGTYSKGVHMTNSWLQSAFGPFDIEINLSMADYQEIAGPSSSAVQTYAIMSALGQIPLDQNTFTTGTILDQDGSVGVIGGVYGKTRGAYLFSKELERHTNTRLTAPVRVLVPRENARELLRNLLFDRELRGAMDDGKLQILYHDTIWDGFSTISGLPREEYEPRVRQSIADIQREASFHHYRLQHGMQDPDDKDGKGDNDE